MTPRIAVTADDDHAAAGEVQARGSRVVFNARANLQAEVVFTDGSHAARVIDKHSAVQLDPDGAAALTAVHGHPHAKRSHRHAKAPPVQPRGRPERRTAALMTPGSTPWSRR